MHVRQSARSVVVGAVALTLCAGVGILTMQPDVGAAEQSSLLRQFAFAVSDANGDPVDARSVRTVQPGLRHIRSWISAVGASGGLADLDGDGLPGEACLVDPRDDSVTILPTPDRSHRFPPFPLLPAGLRYDSRTMAPTGCLPGDLNEDGHSDVLVYFWGRVPVAYLRKPASPLDASGFLAVDVVPEAGQIWNSTTANLLDLDGDGHLDLFVGNYFPDGARVLDPDAGDDPLMRMQDSMSNATNGGRNVILRLDHLADVDGLRVPRYTDASSALTRAQAQSWTLATGAQDLNHDGLPEFYVANDFGRDYLLLNSSTPGQIRFSELHGQRTASTPKSKVLGYDSFKSMGVAYTDCNRDGRPDLVVSNITTAHGLEESNFAFVSTGTGPIVDAVAPYRDDSEALGLSRSGWGWDIKAADFDGDGTDELVQAVGFVAGTRDKWPQLQELAMTNDDVLRFPWAWPNFEPGGDIAGHQRNPFFVRTASGRYTDLAAALGLDNPGPSRGLAVGDVDHDGRPDVLVSNQWARSRFLHNTGPDRGYLGLRLLLPPVAGVSGALPRSATGAAVTVTKADGTLLRQQLFPANGHTGVNAPELLFGLGAPSRDPLGVTVTWRDGAGLHTTSVTLRPGWHDITLNAAVG